MTKKEIKIMSDKKYWNEIYLGLINSNFSLHYFDMNKTMEIFDEIYKTIEIGDLFIGRVDSDRNDYVNDNYIEIEKIFIMIQCTNNTKGYLIKNN